MTTSYPIHCLHRSISVFFSPPPRLEEEEDAAARPPLFKANSLTLLWLHAGEETLWTDISASFLPARIVSCRV